MTTFVGDNAPTTEQFIEAVDILSEQGSIELAAGIIFSGWHRFSPIIGGRDIAWQLGGTERWERLPEWQQCALRMRDDGLSREKPEVLALVAHKVAELLRTADEAERYRRQAYYQ